MLQNFRRYYFVFFELKNKSYILFDVTEPEKELGLAEREFLLKTVYKSAGGHPERDIRLLNIGMQMHTAPDK